ncbi:hypothetical protein M422DRAFT_776802 [Sphaerobolus stellatus SS14]|nr:hypothetical protein M422DRAFT_776802 [Sphaerobolus stellatus SS14]
MTTGESVPAHKSHIPADEDIAQLVLSLAVNTYVNGQNVEVKGGYLLTHP